MGEGTFSKRPHGITIGPDDSVYIVDEGNNSVRRYTVEGELKSVIGVGGRASGSGIDHSIAALPDRIHSIRRAAGPFNKPTKLAWPQAATYTFRTGTAMHGFITSTLRATY